MALESVSRGPLFMRYAENYWFHSDPSLNSFRPQTAPETQPLRGGLDNGTSRKNPKSSRSSCTSRADQIRRWEAANGIFDCEMMKNNDNFQMQDYPFQSTLQRPLDNLNMTPVMMAIGNQLHSTRIGYPDDSHLKGTSGIRLMSPETNELPKHNNRIDFDLAHLQSSIRYNAHSAGSWRSLDVSQRSSARSVSSGRFSITEDPISGRISSNNDSASNRAPLPDTSLEIMNRNLRNLWTFKCDEIRGPWTPTCTEEITRSSSFSGSSSSMHRCDDASLKNSRMEEHDRLMAKLKQVRQRYDDLPIDMTCRKRKLKTMIDKTSGTTTNTSPALNEPEQDSTRGEIRPRLSSFAEPSILRSMLTERGRCYSMSAIEMRRRRLAYRADCPSVEANSSVTASSPITGIPSEKQLVTLAKKNLLPVMARITDLLGKIVDFAKSLPEFLLLSLADQEILLTSSSLRLLLLSMAETNLQFATTIVAADTTVTSGGDDGQQVDAAMSSGDPDNTKIPTTQFVNSIQYFICKCQLLNITSEEYFHMKVITLFRSGIGSMECTLAANRASSCARVALQCLTSRPGSNDKLRYSSLLLSLHTLYGIHCGMVRSLFCRHLEKSGGIRAVVVNALSSSSSSS